MDNLSRMRKLAGLPPMPSKRLLAENADPNIQWRGPYAFPTADGDYALYVEDESAIDAITEISLQDPNGDELDNWGGIRAVEDPNDLLDDAPIYVTNAQIAKAKAAMEEAMADFLDAVGADDDDDDYGDEFGDGMDEETFYSIWHDILGLR